MISRSLYSFEVHGRQYHGQRLAAESEGEESGTLNTI